MSDAQTIGSHHNTPVRELKDVVKPRPLEYPLDAYWRAPAGEGPLANQWADKPTRLLYDLIAAHLAEPKATGWRDIESAPKDGTWVLLYRPQPELGECDPIVLGRWDEDEDAWLWPDGVCNPLDPDGGAEQRIQRGDYWFDREFTMWCEPPTGAPLPPPPGQDVGNTDTIETLRAENAELKARYDKLEAAAREFFEAYSSGKPMATRARLFASLRSALSPKEGE